MVKNSKKKRKYKKSIKGGKYERALSERISLWWTHGKRKDIFWRTAGSGARAMSHARKGRMIFGQHGDILATDPSGAPLIDLLTIEMKNGYPRGHAGMILDAPADSSQQELESWIQQAEESCKNAGSVSWMIIHKRDRREDIVYLPSSFIKEMKRIGCFSKPVYPFTSFCISLRTIHPISKTKFETRRKPIRFSSLTLTDFLACITPEQVKELARTL